jgi:Putative adhesin
MNIPLIRTTLGTTLLATLCSMPALAGVPAADASFDKTLTVSGPVHLELATGSGDVQIKAGPDGKVHIHGEIWSSWSLFGDSKKRVEDLAANPPIEQAGDTIRVGKDGSRTKDLKISYVVEVPHDTQVTATVASGTLFVGGVRGPVKAETASGAVHVEKIERDTQVSSASGDVVASDIGDFLHASSASGKVTLSNVKGEVRASSASGDVRVNKPDGRVDANTASGTIDVYGATTDTKAHTVSGHVTVQGDPGKKGYWELHSVSGGVDLTVPRAATFYFSADSRSGTISTDIPIVIEEQGKHSLRAHIGDGGGRVEAHSVSGEIRVHGAA